MPQPDFPTLGAIWSTGADGAFRSLHEHHPGLLGAAAGQRLVDWLANERLRADSVHVAALGAALAAGEAFQQPLRLVAVDGHVRHLLVTGIPAGEGTVCFSGAIIDLTAHQHALDGARRSAAEHRLIIDHSDDLIAHCGADGRYLHISASYTRLFGWRPEQMIGRPVIDFLHPDDQGAARAALEYLVTPEARPLVTEVRKRSASGEYIQLSTKTCPIFDPADGRSLGMVLVSRDITEEQEMRRQLQAMARDKLALVESINDGFFSVNADWVITYCNQRAAAFVGAGREAVLGKRVWDVAPGLAESVVGANLRQAMATRQSISFEEFYEPNGVWLSERIYAYADGLSVFFHDISERKVAEAKLEELATRDSLTGLPNRAWINERIDAMLASPESRALTTVFFIDLNRFKEINDSMGHATGDILLRQVSERLKKCMRPGDAVARLGGDEFVVAASCVGREAATAIAQRLLTALRAPFHADGLEMSIGASIGICQASGDAASTQQLFQSADTAMYKAKAAGTGSFEFFEPSMCAEAKRRLQLEMALNRALDLQQFQVHYQPRIDLRRRRVLGMEALLRWHHPELGHVSPLEFIPLAEERGQIEAIGAWVLGEACRSLKRLEERFGLGLSVSINVSARQLRSCAFADQVLHAVNGAGLSPGSVELEVTESALIVDLAQSAETLLGLKQQGIKLSLDDFGTGYSSMSYLRQLPVDVLKLDRTFVNQDVNDLGLVSAMIDMAHALDLSVVAEGIESVELMEKLQAIGCDEGQGYLFAKPMPLADIERYLAEVGESAR
ncbi:EAL domain-containing protein [Massilia sp. METH4]|uniref:putative bifunctional diguanylate cyclase/phosphodiesterase n=1 Tax=Massilia sp. METH4 TaxID=3123041 RepID=UPI0030CBA00C